MPANKKPSLSESDLLKSLIKSQPGLFVLFDKDGAIYWWNTRLEFYSGYSGEEIENLKIVDFIEKKDEEAVKKKIEEAFEKGEADIEIRLKDKSGDTNLFLLTWVSIELEGSGYIIGTGIDITKREEERARKMRYFRVLENSRNEIFLFDANTLNFIYVNEGARRHLGFSQEELYNMKACDIKPEFDEERFHEHIRPLLTGEKEKLKYQTTHQRSDGGIYNVEEHLQLIVLDGEKFFSAIVIDITDYINKEEQVRASLREKEVLLGEVHHRVKNNLAIVSSLLNMQARKVKDKHMQTLFTESDSRIKAMSMIHQSLYEQEDFSKVDFGPYVEKLVDNIALNYQDQKSQIKTQVEVDNIRFPIDTAVPCALIINELITNAFKHACNHERICVVKVSLSSVEGENKLVVSDNGAGLPESFNIEETTSLGMTLVRGLTSQLGGTFEVRQNGGTSFIIKFKATNAMFQERMPFRSDNLPDH